MGKEVRCFTTVTFLSFISLISTFIFDYGNWQSLPFHHYEGLHPLTSQSPTHDENTASIAKVWFHYAGALSERTLCRKGVCVRIVRMALITTMVLYARFHDYYVSVRECGSLYMSCLTWFSTCRFESVNKDQDRILERLFEFSHIH